MFSYDDFDNDESSHFGADEGPSSEAEYVCDSCGETIVIPLDISAGMEQEYVEDCPVCCHPNLIRVRFDADGRGDVSSEGE